MCIRDSLRKPTKEGDSIPVPVAAKTVLESSALLRVELLENDGGGSERGKAVSPFGAVVAVLTALFRPMVGLGVVKPCLLYTSRCV